MARNLGAALMDLGEIILEEAQPREVLERALDRAERTLGALRQRAQRGPGETTLGVDEVRQRGGDRSDSARSSAPPVRGSGWPDPCGQDDPTLGSAGVLLWVQSGSTSVPNHLVLEKDAAVECEGGQAPLQQILRKNVCIHW